jgi:uridine kinase
MEDKVLFISASNLKNTSHFSAALFELMKELDCGVELMALYEFRYALHNLEPAGGWKTVQPQSMTEIERMIGSRSFYDRIQIKPKVDGQIVLDEPIQQLSQMLLVGLATGEYPMDWIRQHFYFDLRGFNFLHRTHYLTEEIRGHLGGQPYRQFETRQRAFNGVLSVGYPEFQEANAEVDQCFIELVKTIIRAKGTPILLAIAGPTAAGKTEIVERLREAFEMEGQRTTSVELDNFLTDRDERERKSIFTQGKQAYHFDLFIRSLEDICQGKQITIPHYDTVYATSSHDLEGQLKPGRVPVVIEPADIVFIEGNFPFLYEEVLHLIGIKVVYLTDDPIRLKRKWRRDIDYRKKYEPTYFRNRYFKDQFIMAEIAYRPQMEVCDIFVDTTGGALWVTPEIAALVQDS